MMSAMQTRPSLGARSAACRQHQKISRGSSLVVRASTDPVLKKPELASGPSKPVEKPVESNGASTPAPRPTPAISTPGTSSVTVEYQRSQAKEMQKYFRRLALEEEVMKAQVFGWTKKNEISNGRWVMFGLLVGMLTEYATGVSFIDQLKLMISYLGIADIYD